MESPQRDEELLAGFMSGDQAMFESLVCRYEKPLYAFLCRMTGDETEAEDLFQETFVRVCRHGDTFEGRGSFKSWLYAIAANACRSHLATRKVRRTGDQPAVEPVDPAPQPAASLAASEAGERVKLAVAALPAEQREVLVLKVYQDLSYPEIARALDRPIGTVKSQMRYGIQKLRVILHGVA